MQPKPASTPEIVLDEVRPHFINTAWPLLEPLLQNGIDAVATTQTSVGIRAAAAAGRMKLWAIYRRDSPLPLLAAAATSTRQTNKGLVAVIDTVGGGEMSVWLEPVLNRFAELAKENGMQRIEIEGRLGWARALKRYRPVRIVMEQVL